MRIHLLLQSVAITAAATISVASAQGREVRVTPDPPCFDDTNRYVDCGNGTITDTVTNLIWLEDASCNELPGLSGTEVGSYRLANEAAAQLRDGLCGLSDGSQPGEWRLATAEEWGDTISRAAALGCTDAGAGDPPSLTDDAGTGCLAAGVSSFVDVKSNGALLDRYWTSSASGTLPNNASVALLWLGNTGLDGSKLPANFVWPVRD